jgi:hypothetical protein
MEKEARARSRFDAARVPGSSIKKIEKCPGHQKINQRDNQIRSGATAMDLARFSRLCLDLAGHQLIYLCKLADCHAPLDYPVTLDVAMPFAFRPSAAAE